MDATPPAIDVEWQHLPAYPRAMLDGGLWQSSNRRTLIVYAALVGVAIAAVAVLGHEIHVHLTAIEAWIGSLGWYGPIVYVALIATVTAFFVPDTLLGVVAGALFGLWWGTAVLVAGGLLGAVVQYVVARRFLGTFVAGLLERRPSLRALQTAVRHDELRMQALLRLTPLNPTLVTYVLAVAGVRFPGFVLACAALIPAWFLQVYFGYVGKHVTTLAGAGSSRHAAVEDGMVVVGLAALVAVVLLVSRAAQRAISKAAAAADDPTARAAQRSPA